MRKDAHRDKRPPLGIFVIPVRPYSVEVHLPPERAPLLLIDVSSRAHHVNALAAAAQTRDAGRARVAAPRRGEDRGEVDVGRGGGEAGQF